VSLRADEISSLIQKQIEGFEEGIELKETGLLEMVLLVFMVLKTLWPANYFLSLEIW